MDGGSAVVVTQTPARDDASHAAALDTSHVDDRHVAQGLRVAAAGELDASLLEERPVAARSSDTSRRPGERLTSALQGRHVAEVLGDTSRPDPRRLGVA
jgi:hypothetical protein